MRKSKDSPSLTVEELRRRRQIIDSAIHTHTIERIPLHPDTLLVLEKYAEGGSLNEFNILMDSVIQMILQEMGNVQVEKLQSASLSSYDNYIYPASHVLKNKYGIIDSDNLSMVSGHHAAKAIVNLHHEPLPERFDSFYLRYIHKRLFENTFEWAGNSRNFPFTFNDGTTAIIQTMKKVNSDDQFLESKKIAQYLDNVDQTLAEQNNFQGLSRQAFISKAASMFALINYIHPFRDGNGRTQRVFFERLAEAAGHQLDFSIVTAERMRVCSILSMVRSNVMGDIGAMKHMFEDISNPEKVSIMKEFISSMSKSEYKNAQKMIIVMPKRGHNYLSFYESETAEHLLLKVDLNYISKPLYVIFKKDYFLPNEVKELKSGCPLSFKVPMSRDIKDLESILIPKETVASLTSDQLIEKITSHLAVQLKRQEVDICAKYVYKNLEDFNEKISVKNILENRNFQEVFTKRIVDFPESISKLAGTKILWLKTLKYKIAEQNVEALAQKVHDYVDIVKEVENGIIKENLIKKKCLMTVVAMPSKKLQDIFNLSKDMQKETLSSSPSLQEELNIFIKAVNQRLMPLEHKWLRDANYDLLAESIGISQSKAKQIGELFMQGKRLQNLLKEIKRDHSEVINMAC
ncbi:BID domain-containing T4SS effector [Bartonella sp. 1-1C]|uniref:BID domain-containing T4SS effector n=1 Tax=Bartonella sp. 1-1C TaxID=515256 RepID=UPI0001F4C3FA|nr:BID domain-containing T4SS effector [Bartonella sp. 1-1C]ATO57487.1 Bartonella effector protein Bep3 [Bartonella sp. 1-1C]CBI80770.1 Bartonella effector protein (Bep); substrate of VirB T4SS [Bartonella sp. 1-1C]